MSLKVQLLDSINEDQVKAFIANDNWAMSQKLDGHRVLARGENGSVTAYNRQGVERDRDLPLTVVSALNSLAYTYTLDGELVDRTYWVFDILEAPMGIVTSHAWIERQGLLHKVVSESMHPHVRVVPQYLSYEEKLTFFERCATERTEGVVFNSIVAPYKGGRNRGILKYKFIAEVDCVIIGEREDGRDNLVLGVYKNEQLINCGRVSALTGDGPQLKLGDVCTVECLYSTGSGKLFQPTKPRLRTDKAPEECTFDQIEQILLNKKVLD